MPCIEFMDTGNAGGIPSAVWWNMRKHGKLEAILILPRFYHLAPCHLDPTGSMVLSLQPALSGILPARACARVLSRVETY